MRYRFAGSLSSRTLIWPKASTTLKWKRILFASTRSSSKSLEGRVAAVAALAIEPSFIACVAGGVMSRASSPQALDLHLGEERHQRVGAHLHDCRHVELDQRLALLGGELELVGIGRRVGDILGALVGVVGEAVQGRGQLDEFGPDGRIVGAVVAGLRVDPGERGVVVVPARVHGDDVGLALAQGAGGTGPAAQLDVAGLIELALVEADQRLELAGRELLQYARVP